MSIPVFNDGQSFSVGGKRLGSRALEALARHSVSPEDIFENMDELNEEIAESNGMVEEEKPTKIVPNKPTLPAPSRNREMPVTRNSVKDQLRGTPIQAREPKATVRQEVVTPERKQTVNEKEVKMKNFDEELEALGKTLEEPEESGDIREEILKTLSASKNAPSQSQIAKWKQEHGEGNVHVTAFGDTDVYVFAPLKRGQWKTVQKYVQKAQEQGNTEVEDELKLKVVQASVLWPNLTLEFFYNSKAGVVDSLYQLIMMTSLFLTPQQAMMLTTQL